MLDGVDVKADWRAALALSITLAACASVALGPPLAQAEPPRITKADRQLIADYYQSRVPAAMGRSASGARVGATSGTGI